MKINTTLLFLLFFAIDSSGQTTSQKSDASPTTVNKAENIKQATENADSLYRVGLTKIKKKEYKDGISELKRALILKPALKDKLKRSGAVIILESTVPTYYGNSDTFFQCQVIAKDGKVEAFELSKWLSYNCIVFYQ